MATMIGPFAPLAAADPAGAEAPELRQLQALEAAGVPVAPLVVASPALEELFYALNNLPAQLNALFAGLDLADPDEDDVEELAPEAQRLLAGHYLLDEAIDRFYAALEPLPGPLRLRRPGEAGVVAAKGQPALLALKRLWGEDWSFEALLARLAARGSIALEARPVLIGPAADAPAPPGLLGRVREVLGSIPCAFAASGLGVTRLAGGASATRPAPPSAGR